MTTKEWGEICYKHGYEDRDKEIIRCKDCKHSIHNVHSTSPNYKYFCEKTSANSHIEYHSENWFCADGERKDEVSG